MITKPKKKDTYRSHMRLVSEQHLENAQRLDSYIKEYEGKKNSLWSM